MTKTTFKLTNTSNNNCTFCPFHTTDYSKALDNIIAANIIGTNPTIKSLYDKDPLNTSAILADCKKKNPFIFSDILNKNDEFFKAANFIANYGKSTSGIHLAGKTYKLSNGSYICFYDDEFQIDSDIYKYKDFSDLSFLNKLTEPTKNIIIKIYNLGGGNININII